MEIEVFFDCNIQCVAFFWIVNHEHTLNLISHQLKMMKREIIKRQRSKQPELEGGAPPRCESVQLFKSEAERRWKNVSWFSGKVFFRVCEIKLKTKVDIRSFKQVVLT